ncbi:MAG: STAS domain-containing protein [Magnetococcales bacterium]|nr:STAS domain-containing protein [Magnetococcales bacterium]
MSDQLETGSILKKEIKVPNPFDFSARKHFLPQIKQDMENFELVLDFSGVNHLDSSALGMLLMAREKVGGTRARISLVNCNQKIQRILSVAQFHMLFRIS